MTQKKTSNIEQELSWLEDRLQEIKADIDSQKYSEIDDRIVWLETPKGSVQRVTATIEQQKKAVRDSLKEYTLLLSEVDKLREAEKAKLKGRGSAVLNNQMKELMSKDNV